MPHVRNICKLTFGHGEAGKSETGCGFNRSMQHTRICASSGGVANEAEAEDLLF